MHIPQASVMFQDIVAVKVVTKEGQTPRYGCGDNRGALQCKECGIWLRVGDDRLIPHYTGQLCIEA